MSEYLVLARKYRSSTFDEVVGQEAISRTLTNAIKTGRVHHAYLFTGTRGVGKTTMARILAKALNCLSAEAPTPEPCNRCDACQRIARGDDMDVVEIDGASNRGIDEIRELRANAIFRPARCRYKVYYIDEVHQITRDAFNALLKTLEEPPGHVKFIFSTTEVEKVPATIVSRCQRFDFRNIPTALIAGHLRKVCRAEEVQADDDALFRIARAAAGSMRDGLSLLDQLLAAGDRVEDEAVVRVLGTPPDERVTAIAAGIADGSAVAALTELNGVLEAGVSLSSAAAALGDVFRNMMIAATCGADSELIELPETQRKAVAELAKRFSTPALVQAVGICQSVSRSIRGSSVARALVEAAVVRLAEAEKFVDPASLIDRLEALSGGAAAGGGGPAARPAGAGEKKKPIAVAAGSSDSSPPAAHPVGERAGPRQRRAEALGNEDSTQAPAGVPAEAESLAGDEETPGDEVPAAGAGSYAPVEAQPPAPDGAPAAPSPRVAELSTAERNHLARDPAVQAAMSLFGGEIVDIRIDRSHLQAPADEEEEEEGGEDQV
jgi:DNA polymerase-3 subunit gamma/tau